jgi:hypothetical protein
METDGDKPCWRRPLSGARVNQSSPGPVPGRPGPIGPAEPYADFVPVWITNVSTRASMQSPVKVKCHVPHLDEHGLLGVECRHRHAGCGQDGTGKGHPAGERLGDPGGVLCLVRGGSSHLGPDSHLIVVRRCQVWDRYAPGLTFRRRGRARPAEQAGGGVCRDHAVQEGRVVVQVGSDHAAAVQSRACRADK